MNGAFPDPEDDPSVLAEREIWKNSIEYLLNEEEASIGDINDYVDSESEDHISTANFSMNFGELEDMGIVERRGARGVYSLTEYGSHLAGRANLSGTGGNNLLEAEEPEEDLEELLEEDKEDLDEEYIEEGYDKAKRTARQKARKYLEVGRPDLAEKLEQYIDDKIHET